MAHQWDPDRYLTFADERGRPFLELISRIDADAPRTVVDLGCGAGNLTVLLARRWPRARVLGVDSSAEMVAAAPVGEGVEFVVGDIEGWCSDEPVDVLVCNAALQWVPGHLDLVRSWPGRLAPGGWLAIQVPGNYDQPSHAILLDLVRSERWRPLLADIQLNRQAHDPAEYLDLLAPAGCDVDAWETTYLHVLPGPDPVTEWYRGTGLRPVLAALDPGQAEEFVADYGKRVREAYPPAPYGTVLPFRRVFVVARRTAA